MRRLAIHTDENRVMKIFGNTRVSYFFIIFALSLFGACDSPIEKYKPLNQDEKEIILVLIQYQDAKNHFDLKRLLSLLHEDGEFSFQCGLMVSKAKLAEMLPGYWAELKSGNSEAISLVHECINGDSYKSGKLNNPHIEVINGSRAVATVLFTKGFSRLLQYFSLRRENGRWLITYTEWGNS